MVFAAMFLLAALAVVTCASDNSTIPLPLPKEGDVCNLGRLPQVTDTPQQFMECHRPSESEEDWPWNGIGIWKRQSCPAGKVFSPVTQTCRRRNSVRRQYINSCAQYGGCNQQYSPCAGGSCGQAVYQQQVQYVAQPQVYVQPQPQVYVQPQPQVYVQPQPQVYVEPVMQEVAYSGGCGGGGCGQVMQPVVQPVSTGCGGYGCGQAIAPRPCPGASVDYQTVQVGQSCSWMSAPLVATSAPSSYMQCQPSGGNVYCGQWEPRTCGGGQVFVQQAQVCAPQPAPTPVVYSNPCGSVGVPVASCNVRNQCPGYSTCYTPTRTCCQGQGW